jgi:hypothetical protein
MWGGFAFLLSLVAAVVALVKDTAKGFAFLAFFLSILSFVLYVR